MSPPLLASLVPAFRAHIAYLVLPVLDAHPFLAFGAPGPARGYYGTDYDEHDDDHEHDHDYGNLGLTYFGIIERRVRVPVYRLVACY